MLKLNGNIDIFVDFQNKMNGIYTKKAIQTRVSALRHAVFFGANKDCDQFLKLMQRRSGYLKIIKSINNAKILNKSKTKFMNAVNVYKELFHIDYAKEEVEVKRLVKEFGKTVNSILNYNDIIRTGNIVGEYAEYLCERFLKLKRVGKSNENVDGFLNGQSFQIKARWIHSANSGEDEFGKIKTNANNEPFFDYFIGFVFSKDLTIQDVVILDKKNIKFLFDSLKRKAKKIKYSDIFDNSRKPKHGISNESKFDLEIKNMIEFAKN